MTDSINDIIFQTVQALNSRKDKLADLIVETEKKLEQLWAESSDIDKSISHVQLAEISHVSDDVLSEQRVLDLPKPTITEKITRKRPIGPPVIESDIRDWIIEKRTFTSKELATHFSRTIAWAHNKINIYYSKGVIAKGNEPSRSGIPIIWEYVKPKEEVIKSNPFRDTKSNEDYPERGRPVAGTGKWHKDNIRYANKDIKNIIDKSRSQGCKIEPTGSGHIIISNDMGKVTISSTPSSRSSISNAKDQIKKILGVNV